MALYRVREAKQTSEAARLLGGHRTFNWQNWTQLRLLSKSGNAPKFGYYFSRVPPFPPGAVFSDNSAENLGAFHTAEIPYAFDHLAVRDWPWRDVDRKLAEKRIFPAVDVQRSGTRREELLLDEGTLKMVWTMRRMLSAVGANEGIELLLNRIAKTESNAQFLASLTKGAEGPSPS